MAKLRDIKNRIHAVSKTRKITRTMEMVSTSKMKRWQNVVLSSRPYSGALEEVLRQLSTSPEAMQHPLMQKREPLRKAAVLFITSNRGLCGAFNINICRKALLLHEEYLERNIETELYGIGKKGIYYYNHRNIPLAYKNITISETCSGEETRELTRRLTGAFLDGQVDRVDVAYCRFVSSGRQEVVAEQLLPLTAPAGPARETRETDFIFEPSAAEIVDTLLPLFAQSTVYRMMAENIASEQAARRKAMKQATDNADEMITFLTRRFNRERQAQITRELSEIVGGSEGMVH
ncbi:MAG: ATP synthase F1 subunit gamma [Candidatus Glassbacteria bacterium RIFCSPLOWO2_12_FULL_58_11]|uniref:ATP synthase gamma chain n=1 Tax=Candidatus Glassbacteria bacterium RIFCSPLOWO2_12_FULL_58_11 TaxID=1817867 RepID=A0A1F5YR62_9BACT|nr:MAG: ATP synthase F1 subunit gamma [Candidatus Glassbacteria bacterium RIFCSPLOWO2_12_FULL_58_11]